MCSESDATTHMENVQNSFENCFAATKKPGLISKPGGARTTLAPLGWKIAGRFETGNIVSKCAYNVMQFSAQKPGLISRPGTRTTTPRPLRPPRVTGRPSIKRVL